MEIVVPDEFKYLYVHNEERPVVKVPHPVLRQKAHEVTKLSRKTQVLIDDMIRIMKKANGIGLAAPQVGVGHRIIVIGPAGVRPMALINPVVRGAIGMDIGQEGCLSIPGLYGDVERPAAVVVDAVDRRGQEITLELDGLPARVVLHEIDHLDGILFIDKVDTSTLHWQHPEAEPSPVE
jgi:peptide deformylase